MHIEVDDALRQQMLKFARLQLANEDLAEDVVQDALLGAAKNAANFAGRAAWKTWVFAILKNKIADALRKKARNPEISNTELGNIVAGTDEEEIVAAAFDSRGHWKRGSGPQNWGDPEAAFRQAQFWVVFETCLQVLPEVQARVFMMREFIGLESSEICKELELSTSNLHVLLHRARLKLRSCLETGWFANGDRDA